MAAVNNKRLAKIWNPGNVRLQTRNCKLKNLMLKVSNITASPLRFSRLKINRRLRDDWARISLRSPISKSYGWKIFGYISLHVRWVIYRPVKITIRNGYVKSYMYFLPFMLFFQKAYLTLASQQCRPRVRILESTPCVGWVCCWFSPLFREVFLRVVRFSPLL